VVEPPPGGRRQNDAKSCSPTRCAAAERIRGTDNGPARCHTHRAENGSATDPVSIRYRYSRAVAENRASNPSGATRASTTATSGPSIESNRRRNRTKSSTSASNETTCPRACTSASVRPATESLGMSPRTRCSASSSTPATVRCPGCRAHPRNEVPSYASVSRTVVTGCAPFGQRSATGFGYGWAGSVAERGRGRHGKRSNAAGPPPRPTGTPTPPKRARCEPSEPHPPPADPA
jgi:hypothetical protein